MTRLAASSPEMWTAIALDNADHLRDALAGFEQQIAALIAAMEHGDPEALKRLLTSSRQWSVSTLGEP